LATTLKKCSKQSTALHTCTEKNEDCTLQKRQLLACSTTTLNLRPGTILAKCLDDPKRDCTKEYAAARKALAEYKDELIVSLGMPTNLNATQKSHVLQIISSVLDPVVLATTRLAQLGVKKHAQN